MKYLSLVITAVALSLLAQAQIGRNTNPTIEIKVHVADERDRPAGQQILVEVLSSVGSIAGSSFTNDNGDAEVSVPPGAYHVRVSGIGYKESVGSTFTVVAREMMHVEYINAQHKDPENTNKVGSGPPVSVSDLNAPSDAVSQLRKGMDALENKDFSKAQKAYEKAIQIYPKYAAAYNGLGVLYMRTGDLQHGKESFEKAISADDHFGLAYVNLAKLAINNKDYKTANSLLQHANTADPANAEMLALSAQVDLALGRLDDAIAAVRKLHGMPHQEYAIAHYIAARAYRAKQMNQEAAAEYKLLLTESPKSPVAERAQAELDALPKTAK